MMLKIIIRIKENIMINFENLKKAKGTLYSFKKMPIVDAAFVKKLRSKLKMSQSLFAVLMNVSNKTIEKWEQGVNPVSNGNAIAMIMFDNHPELVKEFIDRQEGHSTAPSRNMYRVIYIEPKTAKYSSFAKPVDIIIQGNRLAYQIYD